jgi:hypothetical protein
VYYCPCPASAYIWYRSCSRSLPIVAGSYRAEPGLDRVEHLKSCERLQTAHLSATSRYHRRVAFANPAEREQAPPKSHVPKRGATARAFRGTICCITHLLAHVVGIPKSILAEGCWVLGAKSFILTVLLVCSRMARTPWHPSPPWSKMGSPPFMPSPPKDASVFSMLF